MSNDSSEISRRQLVRIIGLGGAAALFFPGVSSLFAQTPAAAPISGDQAMQGAGFFTFPLGECRVSVVSDGGFVMKPHEVFPEVPQSELEETAKAAHISPDAYPGQVNTLLVRHNSDVILIDTGAGRLFGPTAGYLIANLARAGVKPEDVTHVVLSHAHPDHIGGLLTPDGKPRFPKAKVYVNRAEYEFWTGENPTMPGSLVAPEMLKMSIGAATAAFAGAKDQLQLVKPDDVVAGVVKLIDARGHTPGHVALQVGAAEGPHLLFLGDALFIPGLQFKHPEWHAAFDADPVLAASTRRKLLDMAAKDGDLASAAHAPFPSVGYIDSEADTYRWTPKPWTWMAD